MGDNETYQSADVNDFSPETTSGDVFPQDTLHYKWTKDNYGPVWIPKKGASVQLNDSTYTLYERAIRVYEKHDFAKRDGKFFLDGKEIT